MNKDAALQLAVQIDTTRDIKQIFELADQIYNYTNEIVVESEKPTTNPSNIPEISKATEEVESTIDPVTGCPFAETVDMVARMKGVSSKKHDHILRNREERLEARRLIPQGDGITFSRVPNQDPKSVREIANSIQLKTVKDEIIAFTPDQMEVIDFFDSERSGLIATHRQFGKTTIATLFALHVLMNTKKHLYLCVNNYSMLLEYKRRIEALASQFGINLVRDNKTYTLFGTVEFVIPESIAFTPIAPNSMFLVDEAAYISFVHEANVYGFSTKIEGRTIYMSTPNSLESQFTKFAELHVPLQGKHVDIIVKHRELNDLYENKPNLIAISTEADIDKEYTLETFRKHIGLL